MLCEKNQIRTKKFLFNRKFSYIFASGFRNELKKGGNGKQKDYNLDLVILLRHKTAFLLIFGNVKSAKFHKINQKISEKRSRITSWAFSYLVD